ncbi:MAG: hypothetical protein GXO39_09820 [Thermotogae bacterium]|nr:hypothetical protein [Thermotogota bacterium]
MPFKRTVGQEIPKRILLKLLDSPKVPTLMFVGPEGVGKATLAYEMAEILARSVGKGSAVRSLACQDLYILSPLPPVPGKPRPQDFYSSTGSIGINDVRRLKRDVVKPPMVLPYKVVVIMNVENATVEAQNSMLKLLEEGWRRTLFILISSNPNRVLPTIRSRSLHIKFSPLTYEEFREVVGKDDPQLYEMAGHSPGVALNLLSTLGDIRRIYELWRDTLLGSRTALQLLLEAFNNYGLPVLRVGYYVLRILYAQGSISYVRFRGIYKAMGDVELGYRRHLPAPFLHLLPLWSPPPMSVDV